MKPTVALRTVRRIALAQPEAEERLSHGSPAWFVRSKQFLHYWNNHHDDGWHALWAAAPDGAQEMLVAAEPELFFRPPYVGHRGWIGLNLDRATEDEITDVVVNAWRAIAPPRLVAQVPALRPPSDR